MGIHNELGLRGESLAADYLVRHGYRILRRNYRYLRAEIDIIARKDDLLAIVEVKSRRSEDFEPIASTVSRKKVQLLVLAADYFIRQHSSELDVRFDIITVSFKKEGYEISHILNAFYYF